MNIKRAMDDCGEIDTSSDVHSTSQTNMKPEPGVTNAQIQNNPIYNWQPVTEPFKSACGELRLGELMHDDMFGLFEAMSAIEMMDPKMDAGMRCNILNKSSKSPGGRHQPLTFWTAQECGHLPMDPNTISNEDLIGILDETYACLVTWLEGHSLAQTVFTNLYLHSPWHVEHPLLKGYSIAILKLVDLIKDIVAKGSVYEEEDFQPLVYGFKLATEVSEMRTSGMLRELEDNLQHSLSAMNDLKRMYDDQRQHYTNSTDSNDIKAKEYDQISALLPRLRFLRLFYLGLGSLFHLDIQKGHKLLVTANEQLQDIKSTVHLGSKARNGKNFVGFEPNAYQYLLPPTMPRCTEIKERVSAFDYLHSLIERLLHVSCKTPRYSQSFHSAVEYFIELSLFSPCVLSRSTAQILYQPFHTFQASGGPTLSPNANINTASSGRSALLMSFEEHLKDSCRTFLAPPILMYKMPAYNASAVWEYVEGFFTECCRPMCMLIQTFGHNPSRQRDRIPNLLEELALVQKASDQLDTMLYAILSSGNCTEPAYSSGYYNSSTGPKSGLNSNKNMFYFSTWLLYHVLRVMIRYILSGFELKLFSVHEYLYMYWYLYEMLYPWLEKCINRAKVCLVAYEGVLEAQKKAEKLQKHRNQNKKKSQHKKTKSIGHHTKEIVANQGYTAMCAGYFKLLVGLKKDNKILVPIKSFDNECVRYEHRFSAFNILSTPPAMPYSYYMEVYTYIEKTDSKTLYKMAARDFDHARQFFETAGSIPSPTPSYAFAGGPNSLSTASHQQASSNLAQFRGQIDSGSIPSIGCLNGSGCSKDLVTVNKINLVASSVLAKDSSRKVEFDFGTHITFPIIKFV